VQGDGFWRFRKMRILLLGLFGTVFLGRILYVVQDTVLLSPLFHILKLLLLSNCQKATPWTTRTSESMSMAGLMQIRLGS